MFERHPIWEFVPGAEDFNSFCNKLVPDLYLKNNVHESIKLNIEISRRLLVHSFYEYEFLDVSLTHSAFTLEKALKLRYKEITGLGWKKNFDKISQWFFDNSYFETDNKLGIDQLRHIRNRKVHETDKSLGGLFFLGKAQTPIDLINDTYEDVALRKQRKDRRDNFNVILQSIFSEGGLLTIASKKYIVVRAFTVFVDNKSENEIIHCLFLPIYDPTPYKQGQHIIPNTFNLQLKNVKYNEIEKSILATNAENEEPIVIESIDTKNKEKFDAWYKEILGLKDCKMIMSLVDIPINNYFLKTLRNFHKR